MVEEIPSVPIHEAARRKYLTYALSVIQSRALPDVRDGLKPVQRRILYTMYRDLHLLPGRQPRKCAAVVGDVLGHYHPHGDQAVYETLVRMAQPFVMRYPLVEGIGNFGSLDGDPPAAYRYTECRLTPFAAELLAELGQETVSFRPTFDGQGTEPVVLPDSFPHLLLNGTAGIAVGMATMIPPHNLLEVIKAATVLIDKSGMSVAQIMAIIKGPDFPTGGEILESKARVAEIYEEGSGTIHIQGEYKVTKEKRGVTSVVVTSVPYQTNKAQIVAEIGQLVASRKVPQIVDVRDESTEEVRIVLELKRGADPDLVMAYLYRHTSLRSRYSINLTCLVPAEEGDVLVPRRVGLQELLADFLNWRYEVVSARLRYQLKLLLERIHILEGFRKIFRRLDEAIAIIRKSAHREDAAEKLKARFRLDDVQVNAILETRLYRLARLEIKKILDELKEKRKEADRLEKILKSPRRLWALVKKELQEIAEKYGDPRRTKIGAKGAKEVTFSDEDFMADEDAYVIVSRDGWVRRVGKVSDPGKIRLRQGDRLLSIVFGNTKSTVVFFSNFGSAYSTRINDIPPSRGYGDPIQRLFRFRDGERIVQVVSLDERATADIIPKRRNGKAPPKHAVAVSSAGYGLRFSLEPFLEVSTRTGRRYARVRPGEEIVGVEVIEGDEILCCASRNGRALLCKVKEINFLAGPGRGVKVIGLAKDDRLLGFAVTRFKTKGLQVVSKGGKKLDITPGKYRVTSRAGRGFPLTKRTGLAEVVIEPPSVPAADSKSNGNGAGGRRS